MSLFFLMSFLFLFYFFIFVFFPSRFTFCILYPPFPFHSLLFSFPSPFFPSFSFPFLFPFRILYPSLFLPVSYHPSRMLRDALNQFIRCSLLSPRMSSSLFIASHKCVTIRAIICISLSRWLVEYLCPHPHFGAINVLHVAIISKIGIGWRQTRRRSC